MRYLLLAASFLAIAAAGEARAATATISGKYIFRQTIICQPSTGEKSRAEQDMGTANFAPATHKVALKGFAVFGPVVEKAPVPTRVVVNKTFSYSNTATGLKLGQDTYDVLYVNVVNGKAEEVYFQGITDGHCVVQGSAVVE